VAGKVILPSVSRRSLGIAPLTPKEHLTLDRLDGETIIIVACMRARRDPHRWQRRI
jgi:hypothetical protein